MSVLLNHFSLSYTQCILIGICAMLIGMSKTGVPGVSMIVVPVVPVVRAGAGVYISACICACGSASACISACGSASACVSACGSASACASACGSTSA